MKTRTGGAPVGLALLLLGVSGCGGNGLVGATGRLTYKGQPVPSTRVIFQPEDVNSRRSTGVTNDDGRFTLRFSRTENGVKLGKHKVYLKYDISVEEETSQIPPKASRELRKIIDKYGDPEKSPLRYEVTHGGQVVEIQLE